MLEIFIEKISDLNIREVFARFLKHINDNTFTRSRTQFIEKDLPAGDTTITHGIRGKPKDIILLNSSNPSATVTFSAFNNGSLEVSTNQPTVVRFIIGDFR